MMYRFNSADNNPDQPLKVRVANEPIGVNLSRLPLDVMMIASGGGLPKPKSRKFRWTPGGPILSQQQEQEGFLRPAYSKAHEIMRHRWQEAKDESDELLG